MTLAAIAAERAAQKEKPEIEASTANFLDMELYDLRGRKKVLSDFVDAGKVVLLSFTAYQADYSPAYNMKLAELYKNTSRKGWKYIKFLWMPTSRLGKLRPIISRGFVCETLKAFIRIMPPCIM